MENNKYCSNCGAILQEGIAYCPNCGTNLNSMNTTNVQPAQPVQNNNVEDKPIKGALLGFVLTFFLSGLGLILSLILGDKACRKAAIITFVATIVISVISILLIAYLYALSF